MFEQLQSTISGVGTAVSSLGLRQRIFSELIRIPLIDPHSHINPLQAASKTLADILGYHYYTELAHSAGYQKELIEAPEITPKERTRRLVENLSPIRNTVQYSWLIEICSAFFEFQHAELNAENWEALFDRAQEMMASPDWEKKVLAQSKLLGVFLTNDFDDPLEGFDTSFYIPCLRTDDLVFHLTNPAIQERFVKSTGIPPVTPENVKNGIGKRFQHFLAHGAKACAISLPPDFSPAKVNPTTIEPILARVHKGEGVTLDDQRLLSQFVFWTISEFCQEFKLPFDLMIGVNRKVYPQGVYQGQDLFDQRCSLIQYKELFNSFPSVKFPISVLASTSNQELVAYSWIFPNVYTNGHWWYSNIPAYIALDCRSRLQAVPMTKQIGYYSDMYKIEFGLPKFNMYRQVLAQVLAEDFVIDRRWSEENAIELGHRVLRGNVEEIFGITPQSGAP